MRTLQIVEFSAKKFDAEIGSLITITKGTLVIEGIITEIHMPNDQTDRWRVILIPVEGIEPKGFIEIGPGVVIVDHDALVKTTRDYMISCGINCGVSAATIEGPYFYMGEGLCVACSLVGLHIRWEADGGYLGGNMELSWALLDKLRLNMAEGL